MTEQERNAHNQPLGTPTMLPPHMIVELNIRQMREALILIRDEAATKENGGAWAGGIAQLCLATLRA